VIATQDELDQVTGAANLIPDSDCTRVQPATSKPLITKPATNTEYTFSTKVARAEAHMRISISTSTGLPERVHVNGPQLVYGRSLSRPGKPPQVVLRTNGLRYTELLEYAYAKPLRR
jgi:hypothetical protein